MSKRLSIATALTLIVGLAAPMAHAAGQPPECVNPPVSAGPVPDWYLERCVSGRTLAPYHEYFPGRGPGSMVWYKSNFPAPLSVKTAPLPTLTFTTVGPNDKTLFAMAWNKTATTLYAVENVTNNFGTINQTTGAFTVIGALNPTPAGIPTGLAFDPTSDLVYFVSTDDTTARLYTVNVTNAAITTVGSISGSPFTIDITIDNAGQMYGHDIEFDRLIRIDKATGAATVVGPTGLAANYAQGMTHDPTDDKIYGCAYVTPAFQGLLVEFNKATGAATTVAGPVSDEMECSVKEPVTPDPDLHPTALAVDAAGNQVMEPGETVTVAPTWHNANTVSWPSVTGTFSGFTGPAGGTYTITDSTAAYGTIGAGATASCTTDCYGVSASATTRPAAHWDATVGEALSLAGMNKTWTLHVGGSFTDVPGTSLYYRYIETLLHKGVTAGCSAGIYCPGTSTTREQMAAFVLLAKEGAGYTPPGCVPPNLFSDVPETNPFCRFIEELANRGVVAGCSPTTYCPTAAVTREQMAVFVLKTLDPTINPPACAPPNLFGDVPETSPFCRWIEELANRGVVSGCGGGNYCPANPVTREQMGVFLSRGFSLSLYGV